MSISVAPLGSFGSKLSLNAAELPKLDAEFEEITEGEELTKKENRAAWDAARQTERSAARRVRESRGDDCINRKTKWAALEALVGDPKRIALVAADLVAHFEKRLEAMDGKATGRMPNEEFRMSK